MKTGLNRVSDKNTASTKYILIIISLVLIANVAVMGTLMYLASKAESLTNTFTPAHVDSEIEEEFDGTYKTNVNAINTGDINAYLRIKFVTYRVNDSGERIGGETFVPEFILGDGWFEKDGFYYYNKPVAPEKSPESPLVGKEGIKLASYNDVDGGNQVIEVMAEAIQAVPVNVVQEKWHVNLDTDGITIKGN